MEQRTLRQLLLNQLLAQQEFLIPPIGYLEKLRKICTDNDIILIFDEVITGFGRLGKTICCRFFLILNLI